jgi:hypothetical protein
MRLTTKILALCAVLPLCSADAQKVFVAPSNETVYSDTDVREGDPPTHLIYVINRSTVPVTVFNVSLSSCENIRMSCGSRKVNIKIRGGQRAQVLRVEPRSPNQGFHYRFHFSWNADSADAAVRGALGISKELSRDDFAKLGPRITSLRAEPESLVMLPGGMATMDQIRISVLDSSGKSLGHTRCFRWDLPGKGVVSFDRMRVSARRVGRAEVRFILADEPQELIGRPIDDVVVPIVVGYPFDPNAPRFTGVALDADTQKPLGCTAVALEDSARNEVAADRTTPTGMFTLRAPRPGTYRVRVDLHGWAPWYGNMIPAAADEEKQEQHLVRFTDQMLMSRSPMEPSALQHATPAVISSTPAPVSRGQAAPVVLPVSLGGSASMPILNIMSQVPPQTLWAQFLVDSAGRIDTTSISLPPATTAQARRSVGSVLPRIKYSPARIDDKPICELVRLQVNFTPR